MTPLREIADAALAAVLDAMDFTAHDLRYHHGHYDPATMFCGTREAYANGDLADVIEAEQEEEALAAMADMAFLAMLKTRIPQAPVIDVTLLPSTMTRREIVRKGKEAVLQSPQGRLNEKGEVVFASPEVGDIVISSRGLDHGLRPYKAKTLGALKPTQRVNAYVMPYLGKILELAFFYGRENRQDTGREFDSTIMVSAVEYEGKVHPVVIRLDSKDIDRNINQVREVLILKSINANEQGHAAIRDLGIAPPDALAHCSPPKKREDEDILAQDMADVNPQKEKTKISRSEWKIMGLKDIARAALDEAMADEVVDAVDAADTGADLRSIALDALMETGNMPKAEAVAADAETPAPPSAPKAPTGSAPAAPSGKPPTANANMAAHIQQSLEAHDKQYHGGHYDGGKCKFRDKMRAEATAMGIADKVPALKDGGADGAGGGASPAPTLSETQAVRDSEGFKKYQADLAAINEKYKGQNLDATRLSKMTDAEKQAFAQKENEVYELRKAYLTEAMGAAEVACGEALADAVAGGGEKAQTALEKANAILADENSTDAQKTMAQFILDADKYADKDFTVMLAHKGFAPDGTRLTTEQSMALKETLAPAASGEGESGGGASAEGAAANARREETTKRGVTDITGKDFWAKMHDALGAYHAGQDLVDRTAMAERWSVYDRNDAKHGANTSALMDATAEALAEETGNAAFRDALATEGLTSAQRATIAGMQLAWRKTKPEQRWRVMERLGSFMEKTAPAKTETPAPGEGGETPPAESQNSPKRIQPLPNRYESDARPPLSILDASNAEKEDIAYGMAVAADLSDRLKIEAVGLPVDDSQPPKVRVGPTETIIDFKVPQGYRFNKAKSDYVKAQLEAATGMKIASIGHSEEDGVKDTLTIKINNADMREVKLSNLVTPATLAKMEKMDIPLVVQKGADGKPVVVDFAKMPHGLVTGQTGSGKSVFITSLFSSIMLGKTPKEARWVVCDPKNEFGAIDGSPFNYHPRASKTKDIAKVLSSVRAEMERRIKLLGVNTAEFDDTKDEFVNNSLRNIKAYNAAQKDDGDKLPFVPVVIDEFASLAKDPEYGKQITDDVDQLLALGRSVGINLMVGTQRADAESVPHRLQSNIPSRFEFQAPVDDTKAKDARKLKGKGDMYFRSPTEGVKRGRGAFISDDEFIRLAKFYRDHRTDKPKEGEDAVPEGEMVGPQEMARRNAEGGKGGAE